MNKKIVITGKTNVKQFTEIAPTREVCKAWNMKEILLSHTNQVLSVNQLFLNDYFEHQTTYQREVKNKRYGYKNQDKEKYLFNIAKFITYDHILELLVVSKLHCCYCKKPVFVLYKNVRDNMQWTLDRINNNQGHNIGNCVICCLRCNIQRRIMDDKKFKFSKQVRVVKKDN